MADSAFNQKQHNAMKGRLLAPGMRIKTNYSGPFRVKKLTRNCTCSHEKSPHLHVYCTDLAGKGNYYLNCYDEKALKSFHKTYCGFKAELDYDYITILDDDQPIQTELF